MIFREIRHKIWEFRQFLKVLFAKRDEATYVPWKSCINCGKDGIWVNNQDLSMNCFCTDCDGYWTQYLHSHHRSPMYDGLPPKVRRLK